MSKIQKIRISLLVVFMFAIFGIVTTYITILTYQELGDIDNQLYMSYWCIGFCAVAAIIITIDTYIQVTSINEKIKNSFERYKNLM